MKCRCSRRATTAVVPVPRKRVQHDVAGRGAGQQHAVQQRLRLLGRMQLQPVLVAQPFRPGAQRQEPVAAHLDIIVQCLHRRVVETMPRVAPTRRPDQRLVRIGEPTAAEIRHRVGLAPDHVVQHPEPQVLQRGADAEDVVVGADHPQRAILAQQPAALGEPLAGEGVVGGEIGEAVPVLIHAVDQAVIRPAQFAAELQVVGRVGEHAMHRGRRQHAHELHAVAQHDLIERQFADDFHGAPGDGVAAALPPVRHQTTIVS